MLADGGGGKKSEPFVALNPRIVRRSRSRTIDWEACLSVPDYAALVSRPRRVTVQNLRRASIVHRSESHAQTRAGTQRALSFACPPSLRMGFQAVARLKRDAQRARVVHVTE